MVDIYDRQPKVAMHSCKTPPSKLCCVLFQELIKQTDRDHPDRKSLDRALEEMKDLSLYVNEVKRDNEALQLICEIQNSITDLQMVSRANVGNT